MTGFLSALLLLVAGLSLGVAITLLVQRFVWPRLSKSDLLSNLDFLHYLPANDRTALSNTACTSGSNVLETTQAMKKDADGTFQQVTKGSVNYDVGGAAPVLAKDVVISALDYVLASAKTEGSLLSGEDATVATARMQAFEDATERIAHAYMAQGKCTTPLANKFKLESPKLNTPTMAV